MLINWPPDFMKQPFYYLEQPFPLIELDELFEGNRVREKYINVAKCVIRENDKNPRRTEYPEIHEKAWGSRYTFEAGYADYVLPNQKYEIPMMVLVSGEPMKEFILELVRDFALFV
mgnify:CR=1 FL=1